MALAREVMGGGDAEQAGTENDDVHEKPVSWGTNGLLTASSACHNPGQLNMRGKA
jgi:hypothetical protein